VVQKFVQIAESNVINEVDTSPGHDCINLQTLFAKILSNLWLLFDTVYNKDSSW